MSSGGDGTSDYRMVRVPRREYDRIVQARERLQNNPDYSWVGHLALGAFIGFLAAEILAENDRPANRRRRRRQ